jgi:hypothetical protein
MNDLEWRLHHAMIAYVGGGIAHRCQLPRSRMRSEVDWGSKVRPSLSTLTSLNTSLIVLATVEMKNRVPTQ